MTELTFTEAAIPATTVGRPAEPNPFTDAVRALVEGPRDEDGRSTGARSVLVPSEDAKSLVAKLHKAGEEFNVTVRKKLDDETTKAGQTMITFWVTPRITRPRKDKSAEQVAAGNAAE